MHAYIRRCQGQKRLHLVVMICEFIPCNKRRFLQDLIALEVLRQSQNDSKELSYLFPVGIPILVALPFETHLYFSQVYPGPLRRQILPIYLPNPPTLALEATFVQFIRR